MNSMKCFLIYWVIFQCLRCHRTSEIEDKKYGEDYGMYQTSESDEEEHNDDKQMKEGFIGMPYNENNITDGFQVDDMVKEREPGDDADIFGTNQHYNIPVNYQDFGRRFVLTYPYVEKNILNDIAEAELDNTVEQYLEAKQLSDKELKPVKAPPEFVLEIAKQSALLESSKPKNPTNDFIQKDILRTGEYWDDVWKEDVNVKKMLRFGNERNKLGSLKVTISPGSKLHKLISMLKKRSPKFLYVINKNTERYSMVLLS